MLYDPLAVGYQNADWRGLEEFPEFEFTLLQRHFSLFVLGNVLAHEQSADNLPALIQGNPMHALIAVLPGRVLGHIDFGQMEFLAQENGAHFVADSRASDALEFPDWTVQEVFARQKASGKLGQVPLVHKGHSALPVKGHDGDGAFVQ